MPEIKKKNGLPVRLEWHIKEWKMDRYTPVSKWSISVPGKKISDEKFLDGYRVIQDNGKAEIKDSIILDIDSENTIEELENAVEYLNEYNLNYRLEYNFDNNHSHLFVRFKPYTGLNVVEYLLREDNNKSKTDIIKKFVYAKLDRDYVHAPVYESAKNILKKYIKHIIWEAGLTVDELRSKQRDQHIDYNSEYKTYYDTDNYEYEELVEILAKIIEDRKDDGDFYYVSIFELEEMLMDIIRVFVELNNKRFKLPVTFKIPNSKKKIKRNYSCKNDDKVDYIKKLLLLLYRAGFFREGFRQTNWGGILLFVKKYILNDYSDKEIIEIFENDVFPFLEQHGFSDEELHKRLDWLRYCKYDEEKSGGYKYLERLALDQYIDLKTILKIAKSHSLSQITNDYEIHKAAKIDVLNFKKLDVSKGKTNRSEIDDTENIEYSKYYIDIKRYDFKEKDYKDKVKIYAEALILLIYYLYKTNKLSREYVIDETTGKQIVNFAIEFTDIRKYFEIYFNKSFNSTNMINKAIRFLDKFGLFEVFETRKKGVKKYLHGAITLENIDWIRQNLLLDLRTNFIRIRGFYNKKVNTYDDIHVPKDQSIVYKQFQSVIVENMLEFFFLDKEEKFEFIIAFLKTATLARKEPVVFKNEFQNFVEDTYFFSKTNTMRNEKITYTTYNKYTGKSVSIYRNFCNHMNVNIKDLKQFENQLKNDFDTFRKHILLSILNKLITTFSFSFVYRYVCDTNEYIPNCWYVFRIRPKYSGSYKEFLKRENSSIYY
jgi:hypothetical protein